MQEPPTYLHHMREHIYGTIHIYIFVFMENSTYMLKTHICDMYIVLWKIEYIYVKGIYYDTYIFLVYWENSTC